jgi:LysR family transcriptional regulator, low CO2-responsive transcriptional regulator
MALMGVIEDSHDLDVVDFVPNELVVVASPRHPLAGRPAIPLSDLGGELFLLREDGSGTRADVERLLAAQGLTLRLGMELRSTGAIKQGVAAELGIAVIPLVALELELATGRLVTLDVSGFPVRRDWSLVRRSGRRLSEAAEALWSFSQSYRDQVISGLEALRGKLS